MISVHGVNLFYTKFTRPHNLMAMVVMFSTSMIQIESLPFRALSYHLFARPSEKLLVEAHLCSYRHVLYVILLVSFTIYFTVYIMFSSLAHSKNSCVENITFCV